MTVGSTAITDGSSYGTYRYQMVPVPTCVTVLTDGTRFGEVAALLTVITHHGLWFRTLLGNMPLLSTVETPRRHVRCR